MARRDRRRGGAHSAPRGGSGSSRSARKANGESPGPAAAADGPPPVTPDSEPATNGADGDPDPIPTGAINVPELRVSRRTRRKQRRAGKQKRSWLDRVLLSAVVLVSLVLVLVGVGYGYIQYRFHQVSKVTVKHLKAAPVGKPFNVLLIGSDSRVDESASDASHFGSATVQTGQRSDVVKILHVDPATGAIRVLSIPRDTVVAVAGDTSQIGKYNRINATYNNGPDQLVQTIEADFGIPISHVVQIDFEGFRGAVDAIGGIWLNFPYPAKDSYTGLNIQTAGCQHVNGGYSLAVARSRHYEYYKDGYWQYDGTSDYGRIERQNAFLKALINQAETKYNPLTLNAFIGSVVQGVTIDSTFNVAGLISLAREFHSFASASLVTTTMPTYESDSSVFGYLGSVIYVQQPDADQAVAQFLGQAPEPVVTPPPGPDGAPATTTTTEAGSGGSTPATNGTSSSGSSSTTTTTTVPDFDPTPCSPPG
ncbi:MAG TPA: LCP family protein [Acidimicrobiales bacterium]|nr:LCP family protein [Acidimicrobiales bacterium]